MRTFILATMLMLAGVLGVSAQTATTSQTANEGTIAYQFSRTGTDTTFGFNDNTDTHGVNAQYTRYLGGSATKAGVVGLTGDLGVAFTGDRESTVTVMGGVTVKARNAKYVQPYMNALAGMGRQNVKFTVLPDANDWASVYAVGGGLAFNTSAYSRYKVVVGADYVNTGFFGERQHGARVKVGLNF
jgi:hypothetical protein